MPKLQDVLTVEEKREIGSLKTALLESETRKDIQYYRKQIDKLLDKIEQRYFGQNIISRNSGKVEFTPMKEIIRRNQEKRNKAIEELKNRWK